MDLEQLARDSLMEAITLARSHGSEAAIHHQLATLRMVSSQSEAVWQPCEPPEGHIVSQIPGNPIYTYQGDGADARWYRLETPRFTEEK